MFVGIMQFELVVRDSTSLKDKRRVVKSVKDRLHREHMVSVAELDALDHHRLAIMGLAIVSNSEGRIHDVMNRILDKLRSLPDAELGEHTREVIRGDQPPEQVGEEPLWTSRESRLNPSGDDDAGGAP